MYLSLIQLVIWSTVINYQSEQKIFLTVIFSKRIQSSFQDKNNAKMYTTKLNLKVQNIYIKPLSKPLNRYNKPCAYLDSLIRADNWIDPFSYCAAQEPKASAPIVAVSDVLVINNDLKFLYVLGRTLSWILNCTKNYKRCSALQKSKKK